MCACTTLLAWGSKVFLKKSNPKNPLRMVRPWYWLEGGWKSAGKWEKPLTFCTISQEPGDLLKQIKTPFNLVKGIQPKKKIEVTFYYLSFWFFFPQCNNFLLHLVSSLSLWIDKYYELGNNLDWGREKNAEKLAGVFTNKSHPRYQRSQEARKSGENQIVLPHCKEHKEPAVHFHLAGMQTSTGSVYTRSHQQLLGLQVQ